MRRQRMCGRYFHSGLASVLGIQFLVIFVALAVAFASISNLEVQKAEGLREAAQAQMAAESGLSLMLGVIKDIDLPTGVDATTLAAALGDYLSSSPLFQAGAEYAGITTGSTEITVPEIALANGGFSCQIAPVLVQGSPGCRLTVTGSAGNVCRRVAIDLTLTDRRSSVFDYGVASQGSVNVSGGARVTGMTDPSEATILSTLEGSPGIIIDGGEVGGELYVSSSSVDSVLLGSGASVAGCTDQEIIMSEHVNPGTTEPEFPQLDTEPIKALAVNVYTADMIDDPVLTNIRIPAGTNPQFTGALTINGVMYVEAPNIVKFGAGVTVNGIIVTQDDEWEDTTTCQLIFRGSASMPGVDALPDDPEFTEVKEYRGTVILAPGFLVDFSGNSGAINGVIAADELLFSGNSSVAGDLGSTILGLTTGAMTVGGSAEIKVNRMEPDVAPSGFAGVKGLSPLAGSYAELPGSSGG